MSTFHPYPDIEVAQTSSSKVRSLSYTWMAVSGTVALFTVRHPRRTSFGGGEKLERNKQRDLKTNRELRRLGWKVIRVWEHENPVAAANRIAKAIHRIQSSIESNA